MTDSRIQLTLYDLAGARAESGTIAQKLGIFAQHDERPPYLPPTVTKSLQDLGAVPEEGIPEDWTAGFVLLEYARVLTFGLPGPAVTAYIAPTSKGWASYALVIAGHSQPISGIDRSVDAGATLHLVSLDRQLRLAFGFAADDVSTILFLVDDGWRAARLARNFFALTMRTDEGEIRAIKIASDKGTEVLPLK